MLKPTVNKSTSTRGAGKKKINSKSRLGPDKEKKF